jgi:hypothetical protein
MLVIPVNTVDKNRMVGKNGGLRRRKGTRGCLPNFFNKLGNVAIACARRCRSSRLTRWWIQKE